MSIRILKPNLQAGLPHRPAVVFLLFFLTTLVLYGITWRAGWAYDTIAWLRIVQRASFREHLNLAHHNGLSHYQLTQTILWLMYRAFGVARLPYFIIHVAIHAFNATLLWHICLGLAHALAVKRAQGIAFFAASIFLLSPYAGEVIVYKAAFHYGLAMAMLLGICCSCLRFLTGHSVAHAVAAVTLFVLSLFSLELSYLTPFYCLLLTLLFRFSGAVDRRRVRAALSNICAPQLLMLAAFQLANFLIRSDAAFSQLRRPLTFFAIKPPLFLLHLLGGRFFPQEFRDAWLKFFCTYPGAAIFYGGTLSLTLLLLRQARRGSSVAKLAGLGLAWMAPAMALSATMWFPERGFIYCDRYLYPMLPAAAILTGCGVMAVPLRWVRRTLVCAFVAGSSAGVLFNNRLWQQAERITARLVTQVRTKSDSGSMLLLNSPWSFRGAPMIFPGNDAGIAAISESIYGDKLCNEVVEAMSFNMQRPDDGAAVTVLDDTTIVVKLRQPGEWVREYNAARSYETATLRLEMIDGLTYRLRLRARGMRVYYFDSGKLTAIPARGGFP